MTLRLYFAYGSNLDTDQMRRRCVGAHLKGRATLHGRRLVFVGHSRIWDGGVASLEFDPLERVQGLLYELSAADFKNLDRMEGYPALYKRRAMTVIDQEGRRRKAVTYVREGFAPNEPAPRYLRVLASSYERLAFDPAPLRPWLGESE